MKTTNKIKSKYKLKKYYLGTDKVLPDYTEAEQQKEMGNNRFTAASSLASMIPGGSKFATTGNALGDTAEGLIGKRADGSSKVGGSALGGGLKGAGTGAALGSAIGPMGTIIGAGAGAVVGTVGGIISANNNQRLVKNAINNAATANYQNKFVNKDIDQIGYAKNGLDLTTEFKYKKPPITDDIVHDNEGNVYNNDINKALLRQDENAGRKFKNHIMREFGLPIDKFYQKYPTKEEYKKALEEKNKALPLERRDGNILAKNGLDMSGDKTKYSFKKTKPTSVEPIYTQQEKQDMDLLKRNPEVYKKAYQESIGYKPLGSGAAYTQRNTDLFNEKAAQFNTRDTTASDFKPLNFNPYLDIIKSTDVNNNMNNATKNPRLDNYITNRGGYVANKMGGYRKGTKSVKPVEVEGDEILMEKSKGKYKMKADFKGGKTHEEGGIPIIAEEGDIIYPANKRNQVIEAYEDNNHSKLESIRKTLPTDTKYKYKKGVGGLDLGGDGAGDGTTVSALQGLTTPKSQGINDSKNKTFSKMNGDKANWGNIASNAAEFAPIAYNLGKGLFDKSVKTNRRTYTPDQYQYTDTSQPLRNEAANAYTGEKDQIRNAVGGSSANYLAVQSLAGSRKYQRMQEINNNEGGRKVAVANMNTESNNNAKMTNLGLQNQYDELDLRNNAAKNKYLSDGLTQISDASQKYKLMNNQEGADSIRAKTLQDIVPNYEFDPNALKDKNKSLYGFKKRMGTQGIKGNYKMTKKNTKC